MLGIVRRGRRGVVVPLREPPKYEAMLPRIIDMAQAGSGIDLISWARPPHKRSDESIAAKRRPQDV